MGDLGVSEFILVIAAVIIGLVIFGFSEAYLVPYYSFTNAQQQAEQIENGIYVTISPPGVDGQNAVYLGYIYSPLYSGNYSVVAFCIPDSEIPSVGVATPSTSTSFPIYVMKSDTFIQASSQTISTLYDITGHILAKNIVAYSVPSDQPFEIVANLKSGYALVVWIIYQSSVYQFRVTYTYEG
ncbi:hypothetical protein DFR86_11755 [Acidianus sulfidivorans JP7]|uniref:Uncharacterized protein n=1 Tax=Acidianus sulfidivorans JP7 TaxID=619593 RepID=A0A2U9IJ88_9CREN|nr:hypothetical protein [Acidianus sulfidivorans]AWR98144.1 hypothetical protein DFR86_11755 [Acidianus sulfidivorans JP7]